VVEQNSGDEGWDFCREGSGDSSNPSYRWWIGGYFAVGVVIMENINVFNVRGSIVTLNGDMSMYTTGFTICIGLH